MRLLFRILLLLLNVPSSRQTVYNPTCEPKIATKQYHDTLIVFLVNKKQLDWEKRYDWYVLKQLACDIPIASNIQTLVVDYDKYDSNFQVTNEDLHDSSKLIDKLFVGIEEVASDAYRCQQASEVSYKLFEQDVVKMHKNVKIVYPILYPTCIPYTKHPDMIIPISFMPFNNHYTMIYITETGKGKVTPDDPIAPNHLKDMSKRLVSQMLGDKDDDNEKSPSCSEENDSCYIKWMIGLVTVFVSIIYLVIVIIWVRN